MTEGYVGVTFSDSVRIFNPGTITATVTIAAYRSDGAGRLSQRVIALVARLNVALDDIVRTDGSALVIQGNVPIGVESVVSITSTSGPSATMAFPNASRTWHFPDGGTSTGNSEYISIFNPNTRTADVRLRPVTADGYGLPVLYHVKPHARAVFVVRTYIQRAGLAAVVEANRQIAAQEVRYAVTGAVSLVDGTPGTTRVWGLADGYSGHGFKEWIILFNPGVSEAVVRLRLIGPSGVTRIVTLRVRARHHEYDYLGALMPIGPVAALVQANRPIVVGRTLIVGDEKGLSTTTGVMVHAGGRFLTRLG